ncbi:PqiC family protein [Catenovulum adriaticum]|uniref:ABC-type transport auxiliary lipoprotein family protein n=1 Tax=Catenovulum adriaticum TaxID=2984846 RepID=A0ABY7AML9_9ALTE|nr:ABC-type transport auxiliary lipoprotein family protein [Catenovulum sp. TS8]WAJ70784.1 ABC-type transport auxiliary lipoprotein family protein [Catenovulum sp. TS8]
MSVKHIFLFSLMMTLVSCTTPKPKVTYYALDYTPIKQVLTPWVKVDVQLPEFLKQENIVIESAKSELTFAHYHRWAEPLDEMVERYISNQLLLMQVDTKGQTKRALKLKIERLVGSVSGQVYLSGYWQWNNATNQRHYFDIIQEQNKTGYQAFVLTTSDLLRELVAQIKQSNRN